ncbi:hypothetical protein LC048_02100 [Mesobacillus subterraneus]|uniref:hypothetical protein n=1 Tax=Mesobacillus subterraneus TaxID=285983 RepID=UPI001CFDFDF1|nr:hypothetical protein [Mesobacillus subterraneus]WLR55821.1 hypothetical protein LC048_02100 [Mesobacillus subterraneus]
MAYNEATGYVPVLVLLAKYPDGDEPVGDMPGQVPAEYHTGSYYFWKGYGATPADSGIHVTDIKENEDGSITAKFFYNFNSSMK